MEENPEKDYSQRPSWNLELFVSLPASSRRNLKGRRWMA